MLAFKDIRGKKANIVRWEALKLLDWEKDAKVIKEIMEAPNPLFFSRRTPEECVKYMRDKIKLEENLDKKEV